MPGPAAEHGQGPAPSMSTAATDDDIVAALSMREAGSSGSRSRTDDARLSDDSSRSDDEEEAAGLVSRLSDDLDRADRRARYEGLRRAPIKAQAAALADAGDDDDFDDDMSGKEDATRLTLFDAERQDGDGLRAAGDESMVDVNAGLLQGAYRRVDGADRGAGQRPAIAASQSLARQAWVISREAMPMLLISLISLVFSGELLLRLSQWPVFSKVDKLFILIPILLNLKGNLEGNLSLRMSTSANIGELDVQRTRETLIFGNLALLQVQALIVASFAGVLSYILGLGSLGTPAAQSVPGVSIISSSNATATATTASRSLLSNLVPRRIIHKPKMDPSLKLRNTYFEFVLVIATSMLSASLSSAVLGSFMCALVVISRQYGINPDNVASPLAGSLGDLLTLSILGLLASFLVRFEATIFATLILAVLAVACGACFLVSYRNAYVRELLSSGWVPLLIAMIISSGAGLVLDSFVQKLEGFALLSPVIAGMPGATAAIFVSRTSTALHAGAPSFATGTHARPAAGAGWLAHDKQGWYERYIGRWFGDMPGPLEGWLVPSILGVIAVVVLSAFIGFVRLSGQITFGFPFAIACVIVCALNLCFSLSASHYLSVALWRADFDPDIYSLPYVTSLVDVVAQLLLVAAYYIAMLFGDTISASTEIVKVSQT